MIRRLSLAALSAALVLAVPAVFGADLVSPRAEGVYVEARTCDVWTGPCFANADFNLAGKNAVMAWRCTRGNLDGLSVVAIIAAQTTLGLDQGAPGKAVLLIDERATSEQRAELVALARRQGGELLSNVVLVQPTPITLRICDCKGEACAELDAGVARIKTRCLDQNHDKACGNESAFFPPLTAGVKAVPAAVTEHVYRGAGLGLTWSDNDRRGAYVGTFEVR